MRTLRKIRVLVVEDSAVARELLVRILNSDGSIEVVGTANDGEEALAALKQTKPDVITMDIHMPRMNGFEATRRIMETQPLPIVIVTASYHPEDVSRGFRAMEAGALAMVEKPRGIGHPDFAVLSGKIVQAVKLMSEVRVVKRWSRLRPVAPPPREQEVKGGSGQIKLIAIGASTGGPQVLHTILAGLPKDLPVPILIVQHISAGFLQGMADWLASGTVLPIHIAAHGESPLPGHVYLAPDGLHMGVERSGRLALSSDPPESSLRPAVSHLFRSVAHGFGEDAVGVLLTGMGKDGAQELKLMKERGAVTIAQDKASSVVHGMPGEAIRLDAATYVLPPEKIPELLNSLAKSSAMNTRGLWKNT